MSTYNGQYNDTINSYFNRLFGRNAADAGLNYWGSALSDQNSGTTMDNLEQSLINGASGPDLDWYNNNVLNSTTNTQSSGTNQPGTQDTLSGSPGNTSSTSGLLSSGTTKTGKYNDQINSYYKSLFGREPTSAGLDYWGSALSDPNSGITLDNLEQSLINGASGDDLEWYNSQVLSPATNTPTDIYTPYTKSTGSSLGSSSGSGSSSTTDWSGLITDGDLSAQSTVNPFTTSGYTADTGKYVTDDTTQLYQDVINGYSPKIINSYQPVITESGVSLATVEPYRPNESDTVQGRLDGLLASGSSYMQNARATGERTAQSRGLLNSSLAAGHSQKAAIESALPIAQQDSQYFIDAGMADYNTRAASALSNQEQNHGLETIQAQEGASSRLSEQDANQDLRYAEFAGLLQSGMSAQEAAQTANLSAQEAEQALQSNQYQSGTSSDLSYQEYVQNSDLSYQDYLQNKNQSVFEGQISSGLSSQDHDQSMELDWQQQAGANYREEVEATLNEALKTMEIASNEKQALADSMTTFGEKFQNDVTGINADNNMNEEEKTKAIEEAQELYTSNVQTLSGLFGVDIEWDVAPSESESETENSNNNSNNGSDVNDTIYPDPNDITTWKLSSGKTKKTESNDR